MMMLLDAATLPARVPIPITSTLHAFDMPLDSEMRDVAAARLFACP